MASAPPSCRRYLGPWREQLASGSAAQRDGLLQLIVSYGPRLAAFGYDLGAPGPELSGGQNGAARGTASQISGGR